MPTLPLRPRRAPTWVSMALVCGFLAAHALPAVAAEIEFKTIVLSGDPASGLAARTTFIYLGSNPLINEAGQVGFHGGSSELRRLGGWIVDPDGTRRLVAAARRALCAHALVRCRVLEGEGTECR